MLPIKNKFFELLYNLNKHKIKYCLVGGWALILYGMFRTTKDVDLFIEPSKENLEKLFNALEETFQEKILAPNESIQSLLMYPVIRYGTPQDFYVDIIFKIGEEITWEDVHHNINYVKLKEVEDLTIPVANIDVLIKMKEGASLFREQDKIDLMYLKKLKQAEAKNDLKKKIPTK